MLKGWSRMWLEGGFKGASKNFVLNDGTLCHTIIQKNLIAICCISDANNQNGRVTHFILQASMEHLSRFFSSADAEEIYKTFNFFNN